MKTNSLTRSRRSSGFSLVELIIVVVIIGLLAAIAIPRFSRGAAGANSTAAEGDIAVLRNAIELYAAEHAGDYPLAATFEQQMTKFTNDDGVVADAKSDDFPYGPYLIAVPGVKVGPNKGANGVEATFTSPPALESNNQEIGWFFHETLGQIFPNDSDSF